MKVQDIMNMSLATCSAQDRLDSVAKKLWDHDCGCVPVVDPDGRPHAMITDRDICMAAFTTGKPLDALRVAIAMSKQLVSCRPDEDLPAAAQRMAKHGVRRVPVVDGAGKLVGLLSLNDLAAAIGEQPHATPNQLTTETLRVLTSVSRHRSAVPATKPTVATSGATTGEAKLTKPEPKPNLGKQAGA